MRAILITQCGCMRELDVQRFDDVIVIAKYRSSKDFFLDVLSRRIPPLPPAERWFRFDCKINSETAIYREIEERRDSEKPLFEEKSEEGIGC